MNGATKSEALRPSSVAPTLEALADQLPVAFREQFLTPATAPYRIVLEGDMHRVWRRHRWLTPLFWVAAQFNMLFPETGANVPVTLVISPSIHRGEPFQTWRRTFRFPTKHRRFTSRMAYDHRLVRTVEIVDAAGMLAVAWDIHFDPPTTLHLRSAGWWLRLGPWRLGLPDWLMGTGGAIERADPNRDDTIHIDLTLSHPLLGPIFGYEGTFHLNRDHIDCP